MIYSPSVTGSGVDTLARTPPSGQHTVSAVAADQEPSKDPHQWKIGASEFEKLRRNLTNSVQKDTKRHSNKVREECHQATQQ